jgi:hypothetical protein
MKYIKILVCFLFFFESIIAQQAGAPGRTTGNLAVHGSASITTSSLTLSCTGSTACTAGVTSGSITGPNQIAGGVLHFTATTDGNGTVGGASGGGAGQLVVTCNGGSPQALTTATYTLPTTTASMAYPNPTCTGVTNLNQLSFYSTLSGSGGSGFNMAFTPSSSISITY